MFCREEGLLLEIGEIAFPHNGKVVRIELEVDVVDATAALLEHDDGAVSAEAEVVLDAEHKGGGILGEVVDLAPLSTCHVQGFFEVDRAAPPFTTFRASSKFF